MISTYKKDLAFLESLLNIPRTERMLSLGDKPLFLERMKKFLKILGNPEKNLKIIHIAGTSGKGSTTKITQDLIASAGYKVGSYTSPYSTVAIEKIRINDKLISTTDFHLIIEDKIKPALSKYIDIYKDEMPSYFEVWTAVAFLYFKMKKCDWVLLETGLGGLHDSTNVHPSPKVTAITNIGMDHTAILGNTKREIALNKAGIIKRGSYFLTTEKSSVLLKIFKQIAKTKKAKYVELEDLASQYNVSGYFNTNRQKNNLNLALNILKILEIKPRKAEQIINNFSFICRQELISKKPKVIIDGSHNADKLGSLIDMLNNTSYKKLHLILGFADDKNVKGVIKKLIPKASKIYLTRFLVPMRKSADIRKLRSYTKELTKKPVATFLDPYQALRTALKNMDKDDLLLITGSFYLAGELRKYWVSEEYILKNRKENKI